MASRYEIHFGVSTFGDNPPQLRAAASSSLSTQLRSALGASESANDAQLLALVGTLRSTLEAVAAGTASPQDAADALASLASS